MNRFDDAAATFDHAMDRARQMISLYDALSALRPREPANDDALRSAYFLAVSSFDFFAHELAAVEAKHRLANGLKTRNIHLPMEIMTISDDSLRISTAETHVRQTNAYKAFVDPGKLAEMLSCYCTKPWENLAARINADLPKSDARLVEDIKGQLKSVWKRRNQIAHEADVNPTLSGVALWPIDKVDTSITIDFIVSIGRHMPAVIAEPLAE
ncbi:HEPN domain-containing protein [Methylobacterium oryzihabitans]|uniref:RiboL-PSP-HEPN domain-containing protein n=1 Tax=Methylobacterium oryzihabitans TaxID=2499852 RepID=A0A437P475_9HYPH|nr:HEPN domain-containing protein [Methylobacterium oryzihabitans]RVU17089.1 hypothetical protein EOE48_14325 [Methylobacterium oryzihabitans]